MSFLSMEFDTREFDRHFAELESYAENQAIPTAARVQKERIQDRTAQGVDVDGLPFKDYSGLNEGRGLRSKHAGYARRRERMGLDVQPPNLRVTGEMLDSIELQSESIDSNQQVLTVAEDQRLKAEGNQSHRYFLGANLDDEVASQLAIEREMKARFKQ